MTRAVNSDEALGSDLNYRLYKQTSGVSALQSSNVLGTSQHILVANTQDVFDAIQRKLLRQQQAQKEESKDHLKRDDLSQNKWPAKMLSCLHPFNLDDQLDESLE